MSGTVHPNPGPTDMNLSLCHVNCRSLYAFDKELKSHTTKLEEIDFVLCQSEAFDIVCMSETWLSNKITDEDIAIPNYKVYRHDRDNQEGYGGVCIYVCDRIKSVHKVDHEVVGLELVWVEISVGNYRVMVGSCYRPPNQRVHDRQGFLSKFSDSINSVKQSSPDAILVLGDFNDKCESWFDNHINSELKRDLLTLSEANNFFQLIDEPTRITDQSSTILDLIFCDTPFLITESGTKPPLGNLDHCVIYCKLNIITSKPITYQREVWDYKTANFDAINEALSNAPFDSAFLIFDEIDDIVHYTYELISVILHEHIRNKTVVIRPGDKPWMSNEVRRAFRNRDREFKRYKRVQSDTNKFRFQLARRDANRLKREAIQRYEQNIVDKLSNPNLDPKKFWSLSKSVLGSKSLHTIPPLVCDGRIISDITQKAEVFNTLFASHMKLDSTRPVSLPNFQSLCEAKLDIIQTEENEVLKLLQSVNINKSSGSDGLNNIILKRCAISLYKPFTKIFNYSLSRGVFPSKWKISNVCPVFKSGDKQNIANYRPIALLSSISKCLEKIVYKRLYEHCIENDLLIENNSGFKKNDSTINLMIDITHKIYKSIDEGKDMCCVFLDVSKAFDKVWHEGLIFKLKQFGVAASILDWFIDYLSNRSQNVLINGKSSSIKQIFAGVPQGSILGPLLFLIYMNDINEGISSCMKLFADDTSLLRSLTNNQDINILNDDLDKLNDWSRQWRVNFNPNKTKYMIFSKKTRRVKYPSLFLNGIKLQEVESHKHLGLLLSNNLSWGKHIVELAKKANRRLDIMTRLKRFLPRYCLEILYKSMIRSILDYGDILYDCCTAFESELLEKIQRRAAILITGAFKITSHSKLLQELGLPTLKVRRKINRLIFLHKIKEGKCPNYVQNIYPLLNHNTENYNFRRPHHIIPPQSRTVTFSSSFFPATIKDWNNLPDAIKGSATARLFKENLYDIFDIQIPHKYYSLGVGRGSIYHTRLRLGLSGLNDHLYRVNLIPSRICNRCNRDIPETITHFLLHCPYYNDLRKTLLNGLQSLICPGVNLNLFFSNSSKYLVDMLIQGNTEFSDELNIQIFNIVYEYLIKSERF